MRKPAHNEGPSCTRLLQIPAYVVPVSMPLSIELGNKWDAISLLRLLDRFRPWTLQLAPDRWIVVGRLDTEDSAKAASQMLAQWAADGGREEIVVSFGDDLQRIPASGGQVR